MGSTAGAPENRVVGVGGSLPGPVAEPEDQRGPCSENPRMGLTFHTSTVHGVSMTVRVYDVREVDGWWRVVGEPVAVGGRWVTLYEFADEATAVAYVAEVQFRQQAVSPGTRFGPLLGKGAESEQRVRKLMAVGSPPRR